MCIWLSIALAIAAFSVIGVLKAVAQHRVSGGPLAWLVPPLVPLGPIVFLFFGVGLVRGGWWLSRGNIPHLTAVIEAALRDKPPRSGRPS